MEILNELLDVRSQRSHKLLIDRRTRHKDVKYESFKVICVVVYSTQKKVNDLDQCKFFLKSNVLFI